MTLSRRSLIATAAAASATSALAATTAPAPPLTSLTRDAKPITATERERRILKLQRLMMETGVGAMVIESGSSLDYFTGVQWHRSERTTAAVIPARGETVIVTPAFEEPSVRETLQVKADVRPWNEHENPFALMAQAIRERGAGPIGFEQTTRTFIVEGIRLAAPERGIVAGKGLVKACRLIKSPAELALMQAANDVTLAALRYTHARTKVGMKPSDLANLMDEATRMLGGSAVEFNLVLLNEASAYPHGSHQPQTVKEGGVVLMDCGCTVHGYQSDISRTFIVGEPTARQRKVWNTVKRGQEIALETAKIGLPVGRIDDAVRAYYEKEGWGPGYKLPGLSHRTGHGIGLDGHEDPYLVRGDETPLQPGMCFSDEPGIYIPGEFGIRLEDCWTMTERGPKLFTPLARSIEDPI